MSNSLDIFFKNSIPLKKYDVKRVLTTGVYFNRKEALPCQNSKLSKSRASGVFDALMLGCLMIPSIRPVCTRSARVPTGIGRVLDHLGLARYSENGRPPDSLSGEGSRPQKGTNEEYVHF